MSEQTEPAKNFEAGLEELEQIVKQMESGDLPLEKSLAIFEEGISLLRTCDMHLKSARGRVMELLKTENGGYVEKVLGTALESFIQEGGDE